MHRSDTASSLMQRSDTTCRVGGRKAFGVALKDASGVQLVGKSDVMIEFPGDDVEGDEDTLVELAFHIPEGAKGVPGHEEEEAKAAAKEKEEKEGEGKDGDADGEEEEAAHPATSLISALRGVASIEAGAAADAVTSFDEVSMVVPRGRFDVEMHLTFLKLVGQSQDFLVRYSSITRLLVLPRQASPYTLVVISLDPPIRKGNTYYPHLLLQFNSADECEIEELHMSDVSTAPCRRLSCCLGWSLRGCLSYAELAEGVGGTPFCDGPRPASCRSNSSSGRRSLGAGWSAATGG